MQKRSHKLLASALLRSCGGFPARRFELAFLLGSVQPDCNPLTYLKGSLRGRFLRGHDFSNSKPYICRRIQRLRQQPYWTIGHYYTLGKLSHYLSDAFTYPHNPHFPSHGLSHRRYERQLRRFLKQHLQHRAISACPPVLDLSDELSRLHARYMASPSCKERDAAYILHANLLLMSLCTQLHPDLENPTTMHKRAFAF